MFFGRPTVVKPWTKDFNFTEEVLRVVPVWLRLPNLPLHYWSNGSLGRTGSALGVPVCEIKRQDVQGPTKQVAAKTLADLGGKKGGKSGEPTWWTTAAFTGQAGQHIQQQQDKGQGSEQAQQHYGQPGQGSLQQQQNKDQASEQAQQHDGQPGQGSLQQQQTTEKSSGDQERVNEQAEVLPTSDLENVAFEGLEFTTPMQPGQQDEVMGYGTWLPREQGTRTSQGR
ncbi:Inverted formin-2 [Bienertia sinuspersici]